MSDGGDWEYDEPDYGRGRAVDLDDSGGLLRVRLPSGAVYPVQNADEQDYVTNLVAKYDEHNKLTNISDLQDLDRVLVMELLVHRWGIWLLQGFDYAGSPIDEILYQRELSSYSTELRQLKKILAIDKTARDRARGEGSIAHYWGAVLERAKAFMVMRNRQFDKGLELSQQLIGLLTFHDNATDDERREFHATEADLLDWLRTVYKPEFEAIDAAFRAGQQRYWIREM